MRLDWCLDFWWVIVMNFRVVDDFLELFFGDNLIRQYKLLAVELVNLTFYQLTNLRELFVNLEGLVSELQC